MTRKLSAAPPVDWPATHRTVLEVFAKGWRQPDPHAWDEFLAEDVELVQPLLRDGRGRALWHEEMRRLLTFAPDLRAEVLSWAGHEDVVFIDLRITATVGGAPLSFRAFDRLVIDTSGTVLRRESFFDPAPVAVSLLRRPRTWWPWWRSGVGPFLGRRRIL